MPFRPPRCPNLDCPAHQDPDMDRIIRWGYFPAQCREQREQRYRCLECRKTFSRQTFRYDYRDRRPDCNEHLFDLLISGVGLRQAARVLKLAPSTVQKKMRKLSRTCALLHENLSRSLPSGRTYLLDEEESYENASIRPLTVPILIEQQHWFVVATDVGSIRRLAPAGTARRKRQDFDERKHGRRLDESRHCVEQVLRALRRRTAGRLELLTDQKSSYATVAREVFGSDVTHATTAGSAPRTKHNPLFPINSTIAMSRDNCGRLRRKSWLVSKRARWLRGQLAVFTVYRNYVRSRSNRHKPHETPAKLLGLVSRQLQVMEVVRWRQDWGLRSLHPISLLGHETVLTGSLAM
ncbi:MAG: transposase-like protein [Planctomycetota bacterium]|jgi:transposase-like protein